MEWKHYYFGQFIYEKSPVEVLELYQSHSEALNTILQESFLRLPPRVFCVYIYKMDYSKSENLLIYRLITVLIRVDESIDSAVITTIAN